MTMASENKEMCDKIYNVLKNGEASKRRLLEITGLKITYFNMLLVSLTELMPIYEYYDGNQTIYGLLR